MEMKNMTEHKIRIDKYTLVVLDIPEEMNGGEFLGLFTRVKKILSASDDIYGNVERAVSKKSSVRTVWTEDKIALIKKESGKISVEKLLEKLNDPTITLDKLKVRLWKMGRKMHGADTRKRVFEENETYFMRNMVARKFTPRQIMEAMNTKFKKNFKIRQVADKCQYIKTKLGRG